MEDGIYALRLHHGHLDVIKQTEANYKGDVIYKSKIEEAIFFYALKGRICCPLDHSEFQENQIVLITKCCRKAFEHHSLTNFIATHEKCPTCEKPIELISITIVNLQTNTLQLEKDIEDLKSQLKTLFCLAEAVFNNLEKDPC